MSTILTVIIIVLFLGCGVLIFKISKDSKAIDDNYSFSVYTPKKEQKDGVEGNTQDFIPVNSFKGNVMCLGNYNYRAIVECGSVNYFLLSPQEQDVVDASFQRFLNSLSFPVEFYLQTRTFDNDSYCDNIDEKAKMAVKKFPSIGPYAKMYRDAMRNLPDILMNDKIHKKYIIIPLNQRDLAGMTTLTADELENYALQELETRVMSVCGNLNSVGLYTRVLDKRELAECLYSYYHRDYYKLARDFLAGYYNTISVGTEYSEKNPFIVNKELNLDLIMQEAQNKIQLELVHKGNSPEESMLYHYIYDTLETFKVYKNQNVFELLRRAEEMSEKLRYDTYGLSNVEKISEQDYEDAKYFVDGLYNNEERGIN